MVRGLVRVMIVGFIVVMNPACRPRLLGLLDSPSFTARDILDDVRQAHSGGRRVLAMRFMAEETFHSGMGQLVYPELAPGFVARSAYDFQRQTAWQLATHGQHTILWSWDGRHLTTSRDGTDYRPILGLERSVHLRALLVLLQPVEAVVRSGAQLVRLNDHLGYPRIRAINVDSVVGDLILEVDPETSLLRAVELRHLRFELEDYREVSGVMVPHQLTQMIPTPGAGAELHAMTLWDVQVDVASAFPSPLEPGRGAPTPMVR